MNVHELFGDKELSREFITSRNLDDLKQLIGHVVRRDGNPAPTERQVQDITNRYQNHYLDHLQRSFGLTNENMEDLHEEFRGIANNILQLIRDNEGRDPSIFEANTRFMETYPYLYFSVIPRQIIESRLTAKCVEQNKILHAKIAHMSETIGGLVKQFAEIEIASGIPPITRSVFESIPDPLSVQYDTRFQKYSGYMDTYHKISAHFLERNDGSHSKFITNPFEQLELLSRDNSAVASREEIQSLSMFLKELMN